jgi:hypothetical protein
MMRQKGTTAPPTSSTRQIGPIRTKKKQTNKNENEKKKKEREIPRQRGDGFARPVCSGTCS